MKPTDFVDTSTGHLVPTIRRQLAFVPAPLPPELDLSRIALPLGAAMQAIGELRGASRRLSNPYVLVRPLQRREALTSSAMEGTFTTTDHLLLAEVGVETLTDESTREVLNYVSALEACLSMLSALPISHRVIRKAHEILLSGLSPSRGARKRPGEYKSEQNWIGGQTIDKARYVPPPPQEAQQCMDALESYINRGATTAPETLIDLALVHYQLEAIHPFSDGNGRVGRMLISLMAVHKGLLDTPILYISPALENLKDEYIDLMFGVSARGAWSEWLSFFFERVTATCNETVQTIDRLIDLQNEYRQRAGVASRSANIIAAVDFLFERPATTVTEAATKLGVTYPAAKATIDKLVEIGILTEYVGAYPKVYFAAEILRVSRTPTDQNGPAAAPASDTSPEVNGP